MPDNPRYTPILPTKIGELSALQLISPVYKTSVVYPLIEAVPGDDLRTAKRLVNFWGLQDPIIVHPAEAKSSAEFLHSLVHHGLKVVPSIEVRARDEDFGVISDLLAETKYGACLRVPAGAFHHSDIEARILRAASLLKMSPEQVDLIVDFGPITMRDDDLLEAARNAFTHIPKVHAWRYIACAASSFPKSLGDLGSGTFMKRLPRPEWSLFRGLLLIPLGACQANILPRPTFATLCPMATWS